MVEVRNANKILVAKRNRPLGILTSGWEDNNKTDLKEIECEGVDWIKLAKDRVQLWDLVNTVMKLRVP
jgi:hypothetical protein